MQIIKGKISIRQALIFMFVAICFPLLRVLPNYSAEFCEQASWLVPIISLIFLIPYIYILNAIFKKYPDKNWNEIFDIVFGKVIGKIISIIFLLWSGILLGLYLRYFAERFLGTIMRDTLMEFLLIIILILAYFFAKNNIEKIGRMVEIFFGVIVILIVVTSIIVLPQVKITNLLPVTYYDILPVLKCSVYYLSLMSYISWIFFFSNEISHKETFKKNGIKFILLETVVGILILISTIGSLGINITQNFQIPFFIVAKNISILESIERIEAIYISIWTITDLAIIVLLLKVISNILKNMFKLKTTKATLLPIVFIGYVFAMYIARNSFELNDFSKLAGIINVCTYFTIPIITFLIGKIRKLV